VEFFFSLAHGLAAVFSTAKGMINVGLWVGNKIRESGYQKRASEILALLQKLGNVSEPDLRRLVEEAFAKVQVPRRQQEEVIAVLLNLSRGARFLTTAGRPRSSYLRCERLIDQLLMHLQPVCNAGETVNGDWRLERYLGHGAFGEVWLASNPGFPEKRAYKMFVYPGAREWLQKEQESLFQIKNQLGDHPNIVAFEDVALGGERPYLAFEYATDGSLEDWIVEDVSHRPPLNPYEVMQALTRGLAAAHQKKIYHRDLKPANVLLTQVRDIHHKLLPQVQAKISDFGLSTFDRDVEKTGAGQRSFAGQVGTPMYLPPEAQNVLAPRHAAQDDVFAIGVIWYQLLVECLERPPYDFADQLREKGQDTHTIRLLSRCLAQPERRFKDGIELAAELDSAPFPPLPKGLFNVEPLVREYLSALPR
jgi:serine/threonine protein kinase